MKKIKDLNFIDIGLPSGNKICVELINNLYRVKELYDQCYAFLPTQDDIREIMMFCKMEPKSIVEEVEGQPNPNVRCGINIIGLKEHFFIPFLGYIDDALIRSENCASLLLTQRYQESSGEYHYVQLDSNQITFAVPNLGDYNYVQTILIKRNGKHTDSKGD